MKLGCPTASVLWDLGWLQPAGLGHRLLCYLVGCWWSKWPPPTYWGLWRSVLPLERVNNCLCLACYLGISSCDGHRHSIGVKTLAGSLYWAWDGKRAKPSFCMGLLRRYNSVPPGDFAGWLQGNPFLAVNFSWDLEKSFSLWWSFSVSQVLPRKDCLDAWLCWGRQWC